MLERIKEHLLNYGWLYIILIVVFLPIGWLIWMLWYEQVYPCLYGHYELQWQTTWCYDSNGFMIPCGGDFTDVFICDCRAVVDTVK